MNDENKNLDAFFSARLQNETVGEDGWNMPSEDIWNAAKPKFVDRKKKKKRFFFWMLVPLLALCVSIPLKWMEGGDLEAHGPEIVTYNDHSYDVESAINNAEGDDNIVMDHKTEDLISEKEINESVQANGSADKSSTSIYKGDADLSEDFTVDLEEEPYPQNTKELGMEFLDDDLSIKNEHTFESTPKKNNEFNQIPVATTPLMVPLAMLKNNSLYSNVVVSSAEVEMPSFPKDIVLADPKFIIPLAMPVYRNEVGISHSQLLLNLMLAFEVDSENGVDEYKLSDKYFNANVTGRKWITRNWSLMTGVQYSRLDLDINFSVIDTLDRELMQFLNDEFNDITSRSTISNQETDVVINLKEGIDTQLGDILNIKGDVRQKIRALQIPVFLDYHIYKRKFEYIFGFGVTLEYLSISESASDFKIFKAGERISEPVEFPVLSERFIDGSIYIKSGLRYKISEQFNFGLDAKINLLGLPFSGLDAGFYYRWN